MSRRTLLALASLALLAACSSSSTGGLLAVGSATPALAGVDQNGARHELAKAQGSPVVVYFYPKDATPGCTKEACAFRDVWAKFEQKGVKLFGVSTDSAGSHKAFADEHKLPFPLIADEEKAWTKAFGVPTTAGYAKRITFLLGRDGKVAKVYENVDPGVHAEQVLGDASAL